MRALALFGLLTLVGAGSSQPPRYPLLSQCRVMSGIAEKLATGMSVYHSGGDFNCILVTQTASKASPWSATDCTQISCQDNSRSISFTFTLMPCSTPPALRVTQNDSHGFVVNSTLSKSQTVAVDLDGPVFLFIGIGQHANKLSLGLQVISVSTTKNVTIVPHTEIPLDKNNCPGSAPLVSDTCRVMSNVTQYLNYFFSTVSHFEKAPECTFSISCNDISCTSPDGGYYNLSILACHSPPSMKLATSGEFLFEHTSSHSEIVPFSPVQDVSLNVTFKVIDHFTIGLALDFTNETASNQPIVVIPYVEMLPNKSMCTSDNHMYTHSPLVTACNILPLLSQSNINSLKKATRLCSVKQNCTISECQLSSLGNATIELRLYGCFQPPAIEVFVSDIAGHLSIETRKISTSKSVQGMVNGRRLELDIMMVQRTDNALVGVEVTANHSGRVFPYHEIPVSCTKHAVPAKVTDTCEVMKDLAHYITVFLANVTNQPELTPECTVTKPPCHSIACSSTDGTHYNVNIFPCSTPPTFRLEVQGSGSTFRRTYSANNRVTEQFDENTQLQVTMSYEVDLLVLELLVRYDDGVQMFSLPAIPYVRIPVNRSSDCATKKPASPNQRPTTSGPYPNDDQYQRTLLAIEVGVPSVLIFCLVVVCFFCLVGRCVHHCVTCKAHNYQYSLLQVTSALESDNSLEEGEYL